MAHIDYYFATISPYTYLAGTRMEEVARRHGAQVTYRPLDPAQLFARTGGLSLKDRHPARQAYRLQELARQSRKAGLVLNLTPAHFPANPAPSAYAIIAAAKAGGGDMGALVHAMTRAVWAEERDIADDAVIRDCLSAAGFDPALADQGLWTGAAEYEANLELAVAQNVFGLPFYVVDGAAHFWGQDRIDDLDAHLSGRL